MLPSTSTPPDREQNIYQNEYQDGVAGPFVSIRFDPALACLPPTVQ